jgi:Tfp pilus assembly protein PilF
MMRCGIGLDGSGEGWSIGYVPFDGPGSMAASFPRRKSSRYALLPIWLFLLAAFVLPQAAHAVDARSERASLRLAEKGVAAAAVGRLEEAQRLLEEAVVSNPANAEAYAALAAVKDVAGNPKLARKYYVIALEIDPVLPAALGGLARLNVSAGDREAAEILLRKLRATCPACAETRDVERALADIELPPRSQPNP